MTIARATLLNMIPVQDVTCDISKYGIDAMA
jgi:hypothetical protein